MRKNITFAYTILFTFTFFFLNPPKCISLIQQKEEVAGKVLSGISTNIEEFFITEPIKIIEFQIQQLEISATNTIPIGETIKIKTKSGFFIAYQISTDSFIEKSVDIKLTPKIVEDKGIEIKIKVSHKGKVLREETVFTRNFESIFVELMEKDDEYKKLANKITPLIHVIEPPIKFPRHINRIEMANHILYVKILEKTNIISSNRSLSAETSDGQIFMYFFQRGLGVYLLSFAPFKGAQPIGVVSDNIIRIKHNDIYLEWISRKPILPEGKWLVWVRINPQYDPYDDKNETLEDKLRRGIETYLRFPYLSGIATDDIFLKRFFK